MLILLHGKGKRKLFHRTSSKNRQMFSRNILVNINTDYYQRISSEIFIDLDNMTFSSNFFLLKRPQEIRWIEYGSVRRLISCHSAPWDVKTKELSSCCGKKSRNFDNFPISPDRPIKQPLKMSMTSLDAMKTKVSTMLKGIERYNPENIQVMIWIKRG